VTAMLALSQSRHKEGTKRPEEGTKRPADGEL